MPAYKGKMIVLTPDGETYTTDIKSLPSLGRLQRLVDGNIEKVPAFTSFVVGHDRVPCVVLCNDEGALRSARVNQEATKAWIAAADAAGEPFMLRDELHGNVVILTGSEILAGM